MVKCPARNENGVKCRRELVQCLRDGMHFGTRRHGPRLSLQELAQWHWDVQKVALGPEWQVKVRAELRRLDYQCKDAAQARNPYAYKRAREDRQFLAGFVVRERKHHSGAMVRINPTTALPIGQAVLE